MSPERSDTTSGYQKHHIVIVAQVHLSKCLREAFQSYKPRAWGKSKILDFIFVLRYKFVSGIFKFSNPAKDLLLDLRKIFITGLISYRTLLVTDMKREP